MAGMVTDQVYNHIIYPMWDDIKPRIAIDWWDLVRESLIVKARPLRNQYQYLIWDQVDDDSLDEV